MNIQHPLVQDQSYLRHFWHPIATVQELENSNEAGVGPIGRVLLEENVVIAKINGEITAMADRCSHRFAKLSAGKVLDNGNIQCPYHGWEYDADGKCVKIPQCPNEPIPKKAKTTPFACEVRYGIIWVRLDSSWNCTKIPYCEAEENPVFKRVIVAEPYDWNSSAERRWENFTDFSHFAYVHPRTLFDPEFADVTIVPIDRVDQELQFNLEPDPSILATLDDPENSPLGTFTYRTTIPFTINLSIRLYKNNEPFLLWTCSSPVKPDTCRNFMIIAHTDENLPDEEPLNFQKLVLSEDKPVIETQPGGLSLAEISLPTDKVSNQYRKWLRELGAAAQQGEEAFKNSLLTDIVESK